MESRRDELLKQARNDCEEAARADPKYVYPHFAGCMVGIAARDWEYASRCLEEADEFLQRTKSTGPTTASTNLSVDMCYLAWLTLRLGFVRGSREPEKWVVERAIQYIGPGFRHDPYGELRRVLDQVGSIRGWTVDECAKSLENMRGARWLDCDDHPK